MLLVGVAFEGAGVGGLDRQVQHALQDRGDLVPCALGGLQDADAVLGVTYGRGMTQAGGVVGGPVDSVADGQPPQGFLHRCGGGGEVALSGHRRDARGHAEAHGVPPRSRVPPADPRHPRCGAFLLMSARGLSSSTRGGSSRVCVAGLWPASNGSGRWSTWCSGVPLRSAQQCADALRERPGLDGGGSLDLNPGGGGRRPARWRCTSGPGSVVAVWSLCAPDVARRNAGEGRGRSLPPRRVD